MERSSQNPHRIPSQGLWDCPLSFQHYRSSDSRISAHACLESIPHEEYHLRKRQEDAGADKAGRHERNNWKQEDLDACDKANRSISMVWSACLPDGSRVRRESHARFCERPAVKFQRPIYWPCGVRCTKQRDFHLGFDTELENLIGGGKGKGTSGSSARPKVPIRRSGTDCLVVALKRRNGRGAKGAGHSRHDQFGQPETGGTDRLWRRAAALTGSHEPCDGSLSCTDL